MLLEVARRSTLVAPRGGSSVVDVRDVAQGVLLAADKGERGRRYVLAGENLTYFEQWRRYSNLVGSRPPFMRIGPAMRWAAAGYGDARAAITGVETDVNSGSLAMSAQFNFYSSRRAEEELGYTYRPADEAILAAWQWFQERGYVRP